MSRERMIYPEMWGSDSFNMLPIEARLLWVGLISLADDYGRGKASSAGLKAAVFPFDAYLPHQISDWLQQIHNRGMIRLYHNDGSDFYDIPKWDRYQKLRYRKDSLIPELNGNCTEFPKITEKFPLKREKREKRVRLGEEGKEGEVGGNGTTPRAEDGASALPSFDWKPHVDRWNSEVAQALGVPRILAMPQARISKLKARLKELPELWDAVLAEAKQLGGWARDKQIITFDFLMSQTNLAKFLEGNYRPKKG